MSRILVVGAILGIFCLGWLIRDSSRYFLQMIKARRFSLRPALYNFGQKIWMTIGLGCVFFGFYLIVILLSSIFINAEDAKDLFLLLYKNPLEYIYWGLFAFAILTLSIYFVRMIIKYLYTTRH